ncbi:PHB depolymerase family esterase [Geminicoccaceae bacterium 1502E]|nr:PHB depolymerase family esterase [Geminicoccaceae bacterium 1502E]
MSTLFGPMLPPRSGGPARQLVVLLHGVGADGQDLIELAPVLAEDLPHAAFIAPDAPQPCDLAPFGRQWFSLQDRHPDRLAQGAGASAPLLDAFLDAELARHGLEDRQMALVGFSQGTMMALFVAPRRPRPAAAVLGFSGALLGGAALAAEIRSRPPVMLVHGDADEVVPVAALTAAEAELAEVRIPVRSMVRAGLAHGIDAEGLALGGQFLRKMLADA